MLTKETFTKRLAKKIQELRKQRGFSQEELADRMDLYRTYIGHLENARYSPSGYILYKLIKVLNINPKELFDL